jgi:hypothetical protein
MTFSVIAVQDKRERVVGTIWAEGEAQARLVASNVYPAQQSAESIQIRPTDQREVPLRLPN